MPLRKLILNYLMSFRSLCPHSIGLCLLFGSACLFSFSPFYLSSFLFFLFTFLSPSFFLFLFFSTYIPANPVSVQHTITNLSKKNEVILFQSQEKLDFKRS